MRQRLAVLKPEDCCRCVQGIDSHACDDLVRYLPRTDCAALNSALVLLYYLTRTGAHAAESTTKSTLPISTSRTRREGRLLSNTAKRKVTGTANPNINELINNFALANPLFNETGIL